MSTDYPTLSWHEIQVVKSLLFHIPESGAEPLHIGHYRVYPPPGVTATNIPITLMAHEISNV